MTKSKTPAQAWAKAERAFVKFIEQYKTYCRGHEQSSVITLDVFQWVRDAAAADKPAKKRKAKK